MGQQGPRLALTGWLWVVWVLLSSSDGHMIVGVWVEGGSVTGTGADCMLIEEKKIDQSIDRSVESITL